MDVDASSLENATGHRRTVGSERCLMNMRMASWALLIIGAWLSGCQSDSAATLDEEEQQWVVEERTVPPTGGPLPSAHAAPAAATPVPPTVPAEEHRVTGTSRAEQVRVAIYPSTIITCDGALEVDYDHSKAVFHDNVHVTDERGELFGDVMEVFFTPAHEIEQVIVTGHVRIVRGEDTAYSERAVYVQKEGKVFLTGQPKLVLFPGTGTALVGEPEDKSRR